MNKKVKNIFDIYILYISKYVKRLKQSKVDFIIGISGFFLSQILGLIFINVIFSKIPHLNGWNIEELIFIYGFSQLPKGIDHFLTDNLWKLSSRIIRKGEFDRYLVRPLNPLFQIICEKVQFDAIGEITIGMCIIMRAIINNVIDLSPLKIISMIISIIFGSIIICSIKLIFSTLAFWIVNSSSIMQLVYEMNEFTKYPLDIYSVVLKNLLIWVIPFGTVTYLPVKYFCDKDSFINTILVEMVVMIIFSIGSYIFFEKGMNKYESTGN